MQPHDLAIPILPSRSIPATVAFYKQLGFEGGAHAFDSGYAVMQLGTVEIHFFYAQGAGARGVIRWLLYPDIGRREHIQRVRIKPVGQEGHPSHGYIGKQALGFARIRSG